MNNHCGRIWRFPTGCAKLGNPTALTLVELLVVIAIIGVAIALLLPTVRTAREPARRNQCRNNLKQIAIAIDNYARVHGALPPAYTTDEAGKPLHSWRTLILPFLEEQPLYESIDLTKPWDAPANAEALKKCPDVFQCPSNTESDNRTTYLAVVTPESCFRPTKGLSFSEITDLPKQTMMVIEVESQQAVPWMSPIDADEKVVLEFGLNSGSPHVNGAQAAFVDGSVQLLNEGLSADVRRGMISIAGNDDLVFEDRE